MIRVLLVVDEPGGQLSPLESMLLRDQRFEVTTSGPSSDALEAAHRRGPHLVIIACKESTPHWIDLAGELKASVPWTKILLFVDKSMERRALLDSSVDACIPNTDVARVPVLVRQLVGLS